MPTYGLKCTRCGKKFELFLLRLLREEDKVCPSCQSREVEVEFHPSLFLSGSSGLEDSGCGSGGSFG